MGRKGDNSVICVFKVTPQLQGVALKQLVNIYSFTAEHFEDQAIKVKRLFYRYKARRLIIDANGIGIGLMDYLVKSQIDPDTNELPSVAYVLQKTFNFMQFLGPILVIVMTVFDLVKTVANDDKDALSKFLKTTSKRLIYAVLLFVFPSILNLILSWITANTGTCGIQ